MRDFKGMKRQRGRNRGGGGGGKPQQHNANRAFESNGPDNLKIRGHAQHVYEKYQQLARDANSSGDRVLAENFLQHAEHYFRLLRTLQPNRPYTDFIAREGFAAGYDIDFEEEPSAEAGEDGETSAEGEGQQPTSDSGEFQSREGRWENRGDRDQNRGDRQNDRQNGERNFNGPRRDRDRGFNRDRDQNRDGQGRDSQARDGRWENREGREDRLNNRDQQPREGRWENRSGDRAEGEGGENGYQQRDRAERNDRYERRERTYEPRSEREGRDPLAVVEPQAQPLTAQSTAAQPLTSAPAIEAAETVAPRRRTLRSHDGDESHTPAFLQATSAPTTEGGEPAPKRRGRPRKKVEEAASEEV